MSEEDASTIQSDLNNLQKWERDWMMSFNPEKCEVIHITNKRCIIKAKLFLPWTHPATYN
jgi:hypothetical protein